MNKLYRIMWIGGLIILTRSGGAVRASMIETEITFSGAWTDATLMTMQPVPDLSSVPGNIVMEFTAWGRVTALTGADTGIGGFDLNVSLADPGGVADPGGPTLPPQFPDFGVQQVWDALGADAGIAGDLEDVLGAVFPLTAPGTFREDLGAGSSADQALGGELFSFFIAIGDPALPEVTNEPPSPVTLGLTTGTFASGEGIDMLTSVPSLRGTSAPSDTVSHTGFTFTVVAEPMTGLALVIGSTMLLGGCIRRHH